LVHPQNGLHGLILNWCIGGCCFTPAKSLGYWTGEWFLAQCDCGLSGWYVMFYAGQYVVEGKANGLGGADMQVRSHFGLWAERMIVRPFPRPSGRIQAHVRTPSLSCAIGKSSQFCQNLQQLQHLLLLQTTL
jgi:hypothetical protein